MRWCRNDQIVLGWAMLMLMLAPSPALALPTPDSLLGVANIIPWIAAGAASLTLAAYALVVKRFGERWSGALLGVTIVLVSAIAFGAFQWSEARKEKRARDLATYLRCDLLAHNHYDQWALSHGEDNPWTRLGNVERVPMRKVAERLERQPDAALIAANELEIAYQSGIPTASAGGKLYPFEFVPLRELAARLSELKVKDLYLADFLPIDFKTELFPELAAAITKFDHVYVVDSLGGNHRYVRTRDGTLRLAQWETLAWPVRDEAWLVDQEHIRFPGITRLLSDEEIVRHLQDEDVLIAAPYSSFIQSKNVYERVYLEKLLKDIDQDRVLPIDLNSPRMREQIERHARRLDGRRFIVVGLTKYNYSYYGLEYAFAMWQGLGRDPKRFRLLGFSARLPEAVALKWVSRRENLVARAAEPFWNLVGWLGDRLRLSGGAIILAMAVLLRLILWPIGYQDARSRMLRARIKRLAQSPNPPAWSGSASALMHGLGVRRGWELTGALLTVALFFPAYELLAGPASQASQQKFLWVPRLGEPDLILSAAIAALVFTRMQLGGSVRWWLSAPASLLLVPLMLTIPSVVLIYVIGVLLAAMVQDLVARRQGRDALDRALLRA